MSNENKFIDFYIKCQNNNGMMAKIRRCHAPVEVLFVDGVMNYIQANERDALVVYGLAFIKDDKNAANSLGGALASEKYNLARLKKLIFADNNLELMTEIRRALNFINGNVKPAQLISAIDGLSWQNDKTRLKIIHDYYQIYQKNPTNPTNPNKTGE